MFHNIPLCSAPITSAFFVCPQTMQFFSASNVLRKWEKLKSENNFLSQNFGLHYKPEPMLYNESKDSVAGLHVSPLKQTSATKIVVIQHSSYSYIHRSCLTSSMLARGSIMQLLTHVAQMQLHHEVCTRIFGKRALP